MRSLLSRLDHFFAPPPTAGRGDWLSEWTYAHRGLHGAGVPENTLLAFAAAADAGLGIECDIQRSSDGAAMVFHDWVLDRMTEERGHFGARTAEFLEKLKYRGADFGVARLTTLLDLVAGRVPLLIEIKSRRGYDVAASCAAVRKGLEGYHGLFAVMSFDPRVSRWFRRHAPEILHGLVMREDDKGHTTQVWQRHLALWTAQPDFLAYHVEALPNCFAAGLRGAGFPLLTWTVKTPELAARARRHADAAIAEAEGFG